MKAESAAAAERKLQVSLRPQEGSAPESSVSRQVTLSADKHRLHGPLGLWAIMQQKKKVSAVERLSAQSVGKLWVQRDRDTEWTGYNMLWEWSSREVKPGADCWGLCGAQCSQNAVQTFVWVQQLNSVVDQLTVQKGTPTVTVLPYFILLLKWKLFNFCSLILLHPLGCPQTFYLLLASLFNCMTFVSFLVNSIKSIKKKACVYC